MKSESEKLARNLKCLRTEKGISQSDIAHSLDVSHDFVSILENGKANSKLTTITRVADALGVSTD